MTSNRRPSAFPKAIASAVSAVMVGGVFFAPPGQDRSVLAAEQQAKQEQRRPRLSTKLPTFSLEDTPFEDALNFLENLTGITFYVDWQRLEFAGVDRGTPLTLQLRDVSARKALTLVLDGVSPLEPLTFYADGGVLHITTQEHADSQLVIRVYDVRDLLHVVPDFVGPGLGTGGAGGGGSGSFGGGGGAGGGGLGGGGLGGGGGGGGGLAGAGGGGGGYGGGGGGGIGGGGTGGGGGGGSGSADFGGSMDERAERLVDIITETVRPEIWDVNGGTATITVFNGNLIINAPRSVHEMI